MLANDVDPDGDTLTVGQVNGDGANVGQAIAGSNGGLFTLNANGSYTFDPNGDFDNLDANDSVTSSISYQATDGEGNSNTATLTVQINGLNETPTITPEKTAVSEEGLDLQGKKGFPDEQAGDGYTDTTNETTSSGTINITDNGTAALTAEINLASLNSVSLSSGDKEISWAYGGEDGSNKAVAIGAIDSGLEVIRIELNDGNNQVNAEGNEPPSSIGYSVKLSQPVDHSDPTSEDTLNFDVGIILSDGSNDAEGSFNITIEDDGVEISQSAPEGGYKVNTDADDIVKVMKGAFGFSNGENLQDHNFTISVKGLNDASGENAATVNQSNNGLSVKSSGVSPQLEQLDYEIDYRSDNNFEELIFKLDEGYLAFGLKAKLTDLFTKDTQFDSANEQAEMVFYRDGDKVGKEESVVASSDAGDFYTQDLISVPGGFDEVRFVAVDNLGGTGDQNSDFALESIEFLGDPDEQQPIGSATGKVDASSADGIAGYELLKPEDSEYKLTLKDDQHTLVAINDSGKVFEIKLTGNTGTWDFLQYQEMAEDVNFDVKATDGDGDSNTITVNLNTYSGEPDDTEAPQADGGIVEGLEDQEGGLAINWKDFKVSENTNSIRITDVGNNGTLQLNGNDVSDDQEITESDTEDGNLVFIPAVDASGFDGYEGNEVGNKEADYAHITFKPMEGDVEGKEAILAVNIIPVADAPTVTLDVSEGSEITQVNGGSQSSDGYGFDVKDGEIFAIGHNVQVWYTNASKGYKDTDDFKTVKDLTDGDIQSILKNSSDYVGLSNFTKYSKGNTDGSAKTDVFLLNENSGYSDIKNDNNGEEHIFKSMNAVKGNAGEGNSADFIFLVQNPGVEYKVGGIVPHEWHNYANHNDNWNIETDKNVNVISGSNQLAGVVTSKGDYLGYPGLVDNDTKVAYDITLSAELVDTDGSEVLSDITLTGVPKDATLTVNENSNVTITEKSDYWLISNNGEDSLADVNLTLTVSAGDGDFSLVAKATATEVGENGVPLDNISSADTLIGGEGNDQLYGGAGADTFKWEFADQGTEENPATDTVRDVNADEGDKLDISELLPDMDDDIEQFIQVGTDGEGETVLNISTKGDLGKNGENADQHIVLNGADMGSQSSSDFLQSLLQDTPKTE